MFLKTSLKFVLILSTGMTVPVLAYSSPTSKPQGSKSVHPPVTINAAPQTTRVVSVPASYRVFSPKTQTSSSQIDYEVWDLALRNIVLRLGQSIRVRASRPEPGVGTRIVKGHKSGFRMEGSRVTFSFLNDDYRNSLTAYRKDLEKLANDHDITRLSKNEQLAYWFNLHNVTLIEQIALNYPVRRPEKLRVGPNKQLLNDAKILNIRGVQMSLRDIRENVVYPNWSSPDVMYGFFRGNIGGPALQNYAFTSSNVDAILRLQANEFVNSLRGVSQTGSALKVSTIYDEARPYYFKNWNTDIKAHLRKHADAAVLEALHSNKPVELGQYDAVVADLLAGDTPSTQKLNVVNGQGGTSTMSPEIARLLRELEQKTAIMRKRGMIAKGGTVTIEDIPTVDVDIPEPD